MELIFHFFSYLTAVILQNLSCMLLSYVQNNSRCAAANFLTLYGTGELFE